MRAESRIARLEDWQRRERDPRSAEDMTDAELESFLCGALGVGPAELTDELLEAVARGERWH